MSDTLTKLSAGISPFLTAGALPLDPLPFSVSAIGKPPFTDLPFNSLPYGALPGRGGAHEILNNSQNKYGLGRDPLKTLQALIKQDHGLEENKKQSLFTMLNTPEVFDHLVAGAFGAAFTYAVSSFMKIPSPARTLLSLAGFGVGNILYNTFKERKFTDYNPSTATARIKL